MLLALALITVSFRESSDGPLHDAQGAVASALQPLEVGVERVARPFRDAYGWTKDLFNARSENEELKAENELLKQQVIQNESALQQNVQLKRLLEFRELAVVPDRLQGRRGRGDRAALVGVRAGDRRHRRLGRRRRGQRGGRDRGRVRRHGHEGDRAARRASACSPTSRAPSPRVDLRTRAAGVVVHGESGNSLALDRVSKREVVHVGDEIVTAGWRSGSLASLYPKGIPIGRVTFVGGLSTDLWQQVLVESDVDFSALDSVLVLVPRRPTPELP